MLFGWAKPIPVSFMSLRHPKRDMMWVGLAGPAVNIVLAIILSYFLKLEIPLNIHNVLEMAFFLNLGLAVFNMIPIPPLDGSRFVMGVLPNRIAYEYSKLEPYGLFIVVLLLNFGMLRFMYPVIEYLASLLGVLP